MFTSDKFWSAVKRKSMGEVLEEVFTVTNNEEAAKIAGETTRMTDAAITRMRKALATEEPTVDQEWTHIAPGAMNDEDLKEMKEHNELLELEKAVEAAIGMGKRKKAKKALKALQETGLKGSVIDNFKKQIKEMEK